MANQKLNLDEIMNSPQAAQLMKDKGALSQLAASPDAQALMQMLNQKMGGELKGATQAAMKGDASQLAGLLQRVMSTPEGAAAIAGLNQNVKQK